VVGCFFKEVEEEQKMSKESPAKITYSYSLSVPGWYKGLHGLPGPLWRLLCGECMQ